MANEIISERGPVKYTMRPKDDLSIRTDFTFDVMDKSKEAIEDAVIGSKEVEALRVDRHPLPALRSLNFVIHGLLEEGVAASTRQDAQAKSLGEWLRARVVELPEALLP